MFIFQMELKPCPFCGGKAELLPGMSKSYKVCCPMSKGGCGASISYKQGGIKEAVDTWNRRV